jgi:alpha-beta hydrolase superfamily lysophospholipase
VTTAAETRRGNRNEQPLWLLTEPDPVLAFLHLPPAGAPSRGTGVLMCPPFGWSDMVSYRTRRTWAEGLAAAGYPTARITFPSMGDSGGAPSDPGRLDAWTESVSAAAAWLRETTGCARVAALGIELGGVVACRALTQGAPIDDLALWAVPNSGRRLVRTMQMHMGVVAEQERKRPAPGPGPDGSLELLGFLITGETRRELEALKLTDLALPPLAGHRVLVLDRDGSGPDDVMREHFTAAGAEVSVADGGDIGEVMTAPDVSALPQDAVRAMRAWLDAGDGCPLPPASAARAAPAVSPSGELQVDGRALRETQIYFELAGGPGFGILTEPIDGPRADLTAVLLNTGATPHIGPNRQWVETARRWAAQGVPTIRMDLAGIGDADGEEGYASGVMAMHTPKLIAQVGALVEQLSQRDLPDRFVLAGACAGAFWSLHAAREEPRVAAVMLIDLAAFEVEEIRSYEAARLRKAMMQRLGARNFGLPQLRTALRALADGTLHVGRRRHGGVPEVRAQALEPLRERDIETLIVLTGHSPLRDRIEEDPGLIDPQHWPNVRLELMDSDDHMFRSFEDQRTVNGLMDAALERLLNRS